MTIFTSRVTIGFRVMPIIRSRIMTTSIFRIVAKQQSLASLDRFE
ncbi:hypothetical protein V3C99_017750 [Haemonchus contortus]|uniref:Uncharacterized protein n=1 Tax=Haemonchus contortus TaxID=6289 RepID=A0A7I4Z8P5_HAECO